MDPDSSRWYLDSGASNHFCFDKTVFTSFSKLKSPRHVSLGNDYLCPILGQGAVNLQLRNGMVITLEPVLYVLELMKNLFSTLSLGQLRTYGIVIEDDVTTISPKDLPSQVLMTGYPYQGLILLDVITIKHTSMTNQQLTELWHRRLGHVSIDKLRLLSNQYLVKGLPRFIVIDLPVCESCIKGKQKWEPHPRRPTRSDKPLDLVFTYVCGPMEVPSFGQSLYFVTYIDDFSGFTCLYFLHKKSETFHTFMKYIAYAERHTSTKLKALQSDNGGEYISTEFITYCTEAGIDRMFTTP